MNHPIRFRGATLFALSFGVLFTFGCGGYSSSSGGQSNSLTSIGVYAQTAPSIPVSGSVKLIANAAYGDPAISNTYTDKDVTGVATWVSSDTNVATVAQGSVTGVGPGTAEISASLGGQKGSTKVIVGLPASIIITPQDNAKYNLSHPSKQFLATATYSDGTSLDLTNYLTWSANPPGVMKFDDPYGLEPGLATFLSTGTATINGNLRPGEEGNLTVTVDP